MFFGMFTRWTFQTVWNERQLIEHVKTIINNGITIYFPRHLNDVHGEHRVLLCLSSWSRTPSFSANGWLASRCWATKGQRVLNRGLQRLMIYLSVMETKQLQSHCTLCSLGQSQIIPSILPSLSANSPMNHRSLLHPPHYLDPLMTRQMSLTNEIPQMS